MRGEGNHKIPGSFAPENMEKTGAERVKYSLACQHEDAIPIKFVPYAQKCPTVLCTFAVALRKESVDRNMLMLSLSLSRSMSLSARRAWIEILIPFHLHLLVPASLSARRAWIEMQYRSLSHRRRRVALRKESVDRNIYAGRIRFGCTVVALRKESVDRNVQVRRSVYPAFQSLSARRAWIEIPWARI